jgi:hypothetical protein
MIHDTRMNIFSLSQLGFLGHRSSVVLTQQQPSNQTGVSTPGEMATMESWATAGSPMRFLVLVERAYADSPDDDDFVAAG